MRTMSFLGLFALFCTMTGAPTSARPSPISCEVPATAFFETGAYLAVGRAADLPAGSVVSLTFGAGELQTLTFSAGTSQANVINAINLFTPTTKVFASVSTDNRARIELRAKSAAIDALHLYQAGDDEPRLYATAVGGRAVNDLTVTPQPGGPFDLTCDGAVGVGDLLWLLDSWGSCPIDNACPPDFNEDGVVNVIDLLLLLDQFPPA